MATSIRELQMALLEMLKDINQICKKYSIKYSLACGTALGAVRHGGFIPWDDDLDIMFQREEYDRFIGIAERELKDKGYTLQKEFSRKWPMPYSKVRKDNTAYIEDYTAKIDDIHQGIFIDLFPIDNLSDNSFKAAVQWKIYHILLAKELQKRGYKTTSLSKKVIMNLSAIAPEKPMRKVCMNKAEYNSKFVHCFLGGAVIREHNIFPRSFFDFYTEVQFEGEIFPIISNYDAYLKICYGDYMRLPCEEERVARMHAKVIDLDRSYQYYLKK